MKVIRLWFCRGITFLTDLLALDSVNAHSFSASVQDNAAFIFPNSKYKNKAIFSVLLVSSTLQQEGTAHIKPVLVYYLDRNAGSFVQKSFSAYVGAFFRDTVHQRVLCSQP